MITLASAYPFDASALTNLSILKINAALGFSELHYVAETAGLCEIKLTLPSFGAPPPAATAVPSYAEIAR